MHLSIPLSMAALATASLGNVSNIPSLTLAFSGNVTIAAPLPRIPIPGGVRTVQAITSGAFSGPGLNATVTGGLSFASTLSNGTVQSAFDTLYGMTSSNEPFLVQVSGIGERQQQAARITIEVGGKERGLADEFLLATIKPNADRTSVTVSAYFVGHNN